MGAEGDARGTALARLDVAVWGVEGEHLGGGGKRGERRERMEEGRVERWRRGREEKLKEEGEGEEGGEGRREEGRGEDESGERVKNIDIKM